MVDIRKKKKTKGWAAAPGLSPCTHHDKATINRIMLRFRPIAPKPPTTNGSVSDSVSASCKTTPTASMLAKRRPKRKYVRVNINNSRRRCKTILAAAKSREEDKKADLTHHDDVNGAVATSQTPPGETISPADVGSIANKMSFELPLLTMRNDNFGLGLVLGMEKRSDRTVESWVVVNGMTTETTLVGQGGLGITDREKMEILEADTCPGLISDGLHRVQWVNLAYKRMVADPLTAGDSAAEEEVVVRLVVKENIPVGWSVFACTVRVVYTWRKEKYSKTMPCDVWKMDFGGFAWRLDAKAALCLGR